MHYRLTVAIAAALLLAACQPRQPHRYVERGYHSQPDWHGSRMHRSWARHQAEIRGDMSYHAGCYPGWCR